MHDLSALLLYRSYLRLYSSVYAGLRVVRLLDRFLHRHGHGDGSAHHGVVAHADKAHHFNVKVECVEVKCLKSLGFGAYRGSFNPIILWISTYINVLLYFDFIVDFS